MSKYHNQPTIRDNIRFDSKHEAMIYQQLLACQRAGAIHDLRMQVRFPLIVNGVRVSTYVADFVYLDVQGVHTVDAKGFSTPLYKLKKRLMKACHDIEIEEV